MQHTAVWTGSEMIVWGGFDQTATAYGWLNSGGRYRPATNSWTATEVAGAPFARHDHSAVWTGSEMIVWGGFGTYLHESGVVIYTDTNTGARYNPVTNTWRPMSTLNAPSARSRHTAVWTGSEMIVWGGETSSSVRLDTGAKYNPVTDTWEPITMANAPAGRYLHSAVWTGTEMIVWGGVSSTAVLNTGAKYNPSSDTWTAVGMSNAPTARSGCSTVWTDSEMIVWGGYSSGVFLNTGSRYNPVTDSWTPTSMTEAPTDRQNHTAVWTGNEMIIWGGGAPWTMSSGSRYDPLRDTWTAITALNTPTATGGHSALWTGSQMLVWGGQLESPNAYNTVNTGGVYCGSVPGQLSNISTRMRVLAGNNALIGGFIISGSDQKRVIVRGLGPSLTDFGVAGALANPTLELHDSSGTLASNDNWKDSQEMDVRTSGLAPNNDLESAIVATLPANGSAYTAVLAGKNGGTGIGLVEVYDLAASGDATLANISSRGFVDTDDNVMIGGVIVGSGDRGASKIVVRAIGPSLSGFGITNPLQDPTLELHNGSGTTIATNDNWKAIDTGGSQENEISAAGLAPTDDRESALLRSLVPDNYTAILRGKNATTGVGVVEIYNLQ